MLHTSRPAGTQHDFFQIVATEKITFNNIRDDLSDLEITGEPLYYLVNGAPFSGTGFGLNPATGNLDLSFLIDPDNANAPYRQCLTTNPNAIKTATGIAFQSALLPNMPLWAYLSSPDPLIANPQGNPPGGANEDYDAADYQNMALAAQVVDPATGNVSTLPSLHRPALINYWFNKLVSDPSYNATFWRSLTLTNAQKWEGLMRPYGPDCRLGTADDVWWDPTDPNASQAPKVVQNIVNFKRRIMLRPLPEDNPDFNGSNPSSKIQFYFDATGNAHFWECESIWTDPVVNPKGFHWDVDNDGDGLPDSIWVDLGMPVRAGRDGKLYKPLFAFLCVDMDGRLNLNAHGSMAQTLPTYYPTNWVADPSNPLDPSFNTQYFAGGSLPGGLGRGRGFGPADINLRPFLLSAVKTLDPSIFPTTTNWDYWLYQNLLGVRWEDQFDRVRGIPDPDPHYPKIPGNLRLGCEGRYGELSLLLPTTMPSILPQPGATGTPNFAYIPGNPANNIPIDHGQLAYNDYLSANKWFDFDGLYTNSAVKQAPQNMKTVDHFKVNGEPADPKGVGVLGVDPAGRPILQGLLDASGRPILEELTDLAGQPIQLGLNGSNFNDLPYEMNLGRPAPRIAESQPHARQSF